ncbi:DNA topoisomerase IV subunit A [Mycoplasmopsis californica HAZ160_1]|uniref:DNA topoisomerase (ATP-hydrolyzing) n=1 Tax=Mycoplasmopsis californica HAZ160_1 TaxID=1397850 RepID=A0AAT9F8W9_9BACT|nr:DNA topoisomerase IV subunit A [Mycoplasmopsis californica]BAP01334.1 DNA topoisomerase IV subunit A [Mycoplasmopsis californica HAZ160_1]BBG41208.1 DNA topoisomerase IV subunit A [Mycoplasmopsis californica]BBG41801.1 DNA topoisomerase IV subunit A [Mycoplasmopsis californica]BBG42395.1 DNA topoisomerase IV subunit A [Mycoplasmopsis californica]BBG42969.1 DNA topoisomerase IV subunit A [Mycoplasmopsis californica]
MTEKNKAKIDILVDKIVSENIDSIMADRFSRYSKYIIQQRALPDVRDGLKPVQRRILYSMSELGLFANKPFKKSARVVGDVIGKYHPHGDSSIYEAMVRMAQDWKMGRTLIEMHGNVGSIDDDPAAAMRYTEVRLEKISEYILGDLKKNTVKFAPNFDDSEKEPIVLPSIIPNLLVNGAKGIASGFATDIPPHNLNEVIDAAIEMIKDPNASLTKLMHYIKGPDFPTGGVIYGQQGIIDAFETGQGKIVLASKYKISEDSKNKYIEIKEIPYGVVKSKLVRDIDTLISDENINGLLEVKDMSDRDGISILITLDKSANIDTLLSFLLQKTDMQVYYNINNVAIVDYSPKLCSLQKLLSEYILHVKDIKIKTLKFDLAKYKARLEIVEGFIKVSEISDAVIKVIRESENGKQGVIDNLIKVFDFTQNQAIAIAELRLYRLSRTDKQAFIEEKTELEELIRRCNILLTHPSKFDEWVIELLKGIKKEFGVERKTEIKQEVFKIKYDQADLVADEEVVLSVTKHGYIKRFSERVKDSNDWDTFGLKEEDQIEFYGRVNTTNNILAFTNFGNYAMVPVFKIAESKWKDYGSHLSEFVELAPREEIVSVINVKDFTKTEFIVLLSKQGNGKRVLLKDFHVSRFNKTFTAIKLRDDDVLISAKLSNGYKDILILTERGLASMYSENEMQVYGTKSNGVKSCFLSGGDYVTAFAMVEPKENIMLVSQGDYVKRLKVSSINPVSKKHLGKPLFNQSKNKLIIVKDIEIITENTEIFVRLNTGQLLLDKLKAYSLPQNSDSFSRIKVDNIVDLHFKRSVIAGDSSSIEPISYEKNSEKETEIIEHAQKEIDSLLDMDVDAILKKFEIK